MASTDSTSSTGAVAAAKTDSTGASLLQDVFRRADKNDDGSLDWEEFREFFEDDTMSESELRELFAQIDSNKNDRIETQELCAFFSQHLGVFRSLFDALTTAGINMSSCLMDSYETAQARKDDKLHQFCLRFFVREAAVSVNHIQDSLRQAHSALNSAAKQADDKGHSHHHHHHQKGRKGDVGFGSRGHSHREEGHFLSAQIDRLAHMLSRFEPKVLVAPSVKGSGGESGLTVRYQFNVPAAKEADFLTALATYVSATRGEPSCKGVTATEQHETNSGDDSGAVFIVSELWLSRQARDAHSHSPAGTALTTALTTLSVTQNVTECLLPLEWIQ